MLARITPPCSTAGSAVNLPAAPGKPSGKTKVLKSGIPDNDGDNDIPATTANSTVQTGTADKVGSKSLPEIQDSFQASQALDFLRGKMFSNPAAALAAQSNVSAGSVLSLVQD
jgi:hypothetical protein